MLEIFDNAVTSEELDFLIQEFEKIKSIDGFPNKFYDDENKELLIWERTQLTKDLTLYLKNILSRSISNLPNKLVFYFVRSHNPVSIHVDSDHRKLRGTTIMIPLTFNENIKTVVWQEKMDLDDFNKLKNQFIRHPKKFNTIIKTPNDINLSHCWATEPSLVSVLNYDGAAAWKKGIIISFNRLQLHCSNNYKPEIEYKDYVLLHIDKESDLDE